jgi:hypothetical protein
MIFAKNRKISLENSSDYEEDQPKTQVIKEILPEGAPKLRFVNKPKLW